MALSTHRPPLEAHRPPEAPRRQDGLGRLQDWSFPTEALSLASVSHPRGRVTPLKRMATPFPSWGEAGSQPGMWLPLIVLFSSQVIKLLPSYSVKKRTGT